MNRLILVLVVIFAAVSTAFHGVDTNPKGLGEKVFYALKKNEVDVFKSFYITPDELKTEIKKSKNKQPFQMVDDDEMIDDYTSKFARDGSDAFSRLRKEGEAKGINWLAIDLDRIDYPYVIVVKDVTQADVFINFKSDGKPYTLKLKDCMHTPKRGWCLYGEVRFDKPKNQ